MRYILLAAHNSKIEFAPEEETNEWETYTTGTA